MAAMTLTEKILARAADREHVNPNDNVWVNVDVLMTHDVCGPGTIGVFFERWMSRLPVPLTEHDRAAGYWWELSMRQVEVSRTDQNMIPAMLEACRVEATLGEICNALRAEWGEYREPARF